MTCFSHWLRFYISSVGKTVQVAYNCTPNFLWPFFVIHSTFFVFHLSCPPSHLQSYNYNYTIDLLQLQIAFYNCRNCHQLHVKICPAMVSRTWFICLMFDCTNCLNYSGSYLAASKRLPHACESLSYTTAMWSFTGKIRRHSNVRALRFFQHRINRNSAGGIQCNGPWEKSRSRPFSWTGNDRWVSRLLYDSLCRWYVSRSVVCRSTFCTLDRLQMNVAVSTPHRPNGRVRQSFIYFAPHMTISIGEVRTK